DLEDHLRAAADRDRLQRRLADIDRRMTERSGSLARQLDLSIELLQRWAFVDGWSLTDRGRVLRRVFHENDVVIAAALCDGLLDGLDPPALAGLVSVLTYEHRSKEPPPPPWFPTEET